MNAFPLAFSLATLTLIAVMTYVMPSLVRRSVPLGVSVPEDRLSEPVIRAAIRRYRAVVVIGYLVCAVLTIILATPLMTLAIILPVFLLLIVTFAGYLASRAMIRRAKRDGDWYKDATVRVSAPLTLDAAHRPAVPIAWYLAAVVAIVAVVAVGAAIYSTLPDSIVTHFDAAGKANAFAPKSVWSVFGPLIVGLGVVVLIFAIALLARRAPARAAASDTPERAAHRAAVGARMLQDLLGQVTLGVALELCAISLLTWFAPGNGALVLAVSLGLIVVLFLVIVIFVVRYRRSVARPEQREHPSSVSSPDNDRFWKLGAIYVNRNDPALLVPKRFGIGWTLNLGHPGGMAIAIVTLLLIVGAVVGLPLGAAHNFH